LRMQFARAQQCDDCLPMPFVHLNEKPLPHCEVNAVGSTRNGIVAWTIRRLLPKR
jgi:hypothetical protein